MSAPRANVPWTRRDRNRSRPQTQNARKAPPANTPYRPASNASERTHAIANSFIATFHIRVRMWAWNPTYGLVCQVMTQQASREATKRETREALVTAGMLEFAEHGLDTPSLDQIS